jgi:hypothetical protein
MPEHPAEEAPHARARVAALALCGGLLLVGVGWFLVLGAWWLNSDGSAYLSLGSNVVHGRGYRLTDGTPLSWWDRPLYPLALTAPWLVHESLTASIWVSRLAFVLLAPLTGWATLRLTRSFLAAAVAGVAAVAQPWSLVAGGSFFVPDGWVTATVVLAVVAGALAGVGQRTRPVWLGVALVAAAASILTKETGALAVPLAGLAFVLCRTRPRRSVVLALLAAVVPATYAATVLAGGSTGRSVLDAVLTLPERLHHQGFGDSHLSLVVGVLALGLVVWAVPRAREPQVLVGLLLLAAGTGLVVYASGAGLAVRNGALLPAGSAFLLGALVHESLGEPVRRRRLGLAGAGALVLALVASSVTVALSRQPADQQGWSIEASDDVARWLTEHAEGRRVGCTLQYCSYYWLVSQGRLDVDLLPQYAAPVTSAATPSGLRWEERVGFRGRSRATPGCAGRPLVVARSDERYGAVFECELLDYVRREHPSYVVVTGWGTLTFDAGALVPYLEVSPAFRRVFLEPPPTGKWWQAMAVYEVVDPDPQPLPETPTYYSALAWDGLPGARSDQDLLMDPLCYVRTMNAVVASATDLTSWDSFPSCEEETGPPATVSSASRSAPRSSSAP